MIAEIYRIMKEKYPILYDELCYLDREIAELHRSGTIIQHQRTLILQQMSENLALTTTQTQTIFPQSIK